VGQSSKWWLFFLIACLILRILKQTGISKPIALRIEQVCEDVLKLNEDTVYTSLLRLQQKGWIDSEWGTSENNRRARFYPIAREGRKQLVIETENWERISGVIGRVLRLEAQKLHDFLDFSTCLF
jgi:DNA-binding PadR family transcriptional regulator